MTKEECIALLKRYADYDGMGIPNLVGCKEAMRMAAELLEHPSLPSDLDEAVGKYLELPEINSSNQWEDLMIYDAFKAGAEWMAGQGVSMIITDETEWAEVDKFVHNNCDGASIIQIRKKD